MDGRNLAPVKLGRTVRYKLSDVQRLVENGTARQPEQVAG